MSFMNRCQGLWLFPANHDSAVAVVIARVIDKRENRLADAGSMWRSEKCFAEPPCVCRNRKFGVIV